MWSCIDYIQTFCRTQGVGGHGSKHTHEQKENNYRTIPKPAANNQFRELLDSLKWQPWDLTLMTRAWHQFLGFWVLEASWDMWQQDKWVIGLQHSGDGKQSCCCLSSVFFLSLRLGLLSTDTLLAQPVSPPLLRLAEKSAPFEECPWGCQTVKRFVCIFSSLQTSIQETCKGNKAVLSISAWQTLTRADQSSLLSFKCNPKSKDLQEQLVFNVTYRFE